MCDKLGATHAKYAAHSRQFYNIDRRETEGPKSRVIAPEIRPSDVELVDANAGSSSSSACGYDALHSSVKYSEALSWSEPHACSSLTYTRTRREGAFIVRGCARSEREGEHGKFSWIFMKNGRDGEHKTVGAALACSTGLRRTHLADEHETPFTRTVTARKCRGDQQSRNHFFFCRLKWLWNQLQN